MPNEAGQLWISFFKFLHDLTENRTLRNFAFGKDDVGRSVFPKYEQSQFGSSTNLLSALNNSNAMHQLHIKIKHDEEERKT